MLSRPDVRATYDAAQPTTSVDPVGIVFCPEDLTGWPTPQSHCSLFVGDSASCLRFLDVENQPSVGAVAENLIRATHDPCGGKFELGAFSTPNQASSCSSCLRASSEKTKFVDKHLGGGESWRAAPRCHCSAPALSPPLEYLNPTFSSSCLSVQCRCTSTTTRPLFAVSWERPSSTAASPCPPPRGACCNLCRRSYC